MTPIWTNGLTALYQADARAIPLPDQSVHCVVTSPPYWGLRDYGLGNWQGGDAECGHSLGMPEKGEWSTFRSKRYINNATFGSEPNKDGVCQLCGAVNTSAGIGLEPTLSDWLENIIVISREVWRVLRDDGTYWLNLGDAYSGGTPGFGWQKLVKAKQQPW